MKQLSQPAATTLQALQSRQPSLSKRCARYLSQAVQALIIALLLGVWAACGGATKFKSSATTLC